MLKISLCINTRNRYKKLKECLNSIKKNDFKSYQIVIIDQSKKNKNVRNLVKKYKNINYFYDKGKGTGRAKNKAINKARGEIIAFTDDDCLVRKKWLKGIFQSFQKNRDVVGVFGKSLPFKPQFNQVKICPSVFLKEKKRIIDKPCLHWKNIGFGNNMAFKREIFEEVGGFKEWLGPGSIGSNAEDAEFALRVLIKGYKLLYNPQVIVYHNRWLTKEEYRKQNLSYTCGELACYGYFAFQGLKLGKKVVKNNFKDSFWKLRKAAKSILLFKKNSLKLALQTLRELFFRFRGLIIGFYYSKKDPL